jgi:phospholipid/cholesterol/gamma-HCH transport system ATP-binding protein
MERRSINSLALEDMTFAFDNAPTIFENVSFALPKSKAVWVRSPGGRGKSTLLKILCGLLRPQSGRYLINGENICEMSFEEFLKYRLNIGYGFDMGGLLNNKTLEENLLLPLQYHQLASAEEAEERVREVIELFGLHQVKDKRPFAIPGSQRKLSCVIRAFVHSPEVVFLDDPLTGLKKDNLNDLFHFVEESYARGGLKQVFFTSEQADLAEKFKAEELLISGDWFTSRSAA